MLNEAIRKKSFDANGASYSMGGIIRLYENDIEVRCAQYYNRERRFYFMNLWLKEIEPLKKKRTFHFSIEPNTRP